jgi:hypothetical protein
MFAMLMACGAPSSDVDSPADTAVDTSSTPADHGDCPRYLACMADLGEPTNTIEATWGEQGACWTGDPTEDGLCRAACADGLDAVWNEDRTPPPGCFASEVPACEETDLAAAVDYVYEEVGYSIGGAHVMFDAEPFDARYLFLLADVHESGRYDLVAEPDADDCQAGACALYGEACPEDDWLYQTGCDRRFVSIDGVANIDFAYDRDWESSGTLKNVYFAKLNRQDEVERTAELRCFSLLEW